jgi:hypothetical protein
VSTDSRPTGISQRKGCDCHNACNPVCLDGGVAPEPYQISIYRIPMMSGRPSQNIAARLIPPFGEWGIFRAIVYSYQIMTCCHLLKLGLAHGIRPRVAVDTHRMLHVVEVTLAYVFSPSQVGPCCMAARRARVLHSTPSSACNCGGRPAYVFFEAFSASSRSTFYA